MTQHLRIFGSAAVCLAALGLGAAPASAGGYCSDMALNCENGRTYPLCPIAVSDEGDLVTAHRCLPRGAERMCAWCRSATDIVMPVVVCGSDGIRQDATLYFGMHTPPVQCTVVKP